MIEHHQIRPFREIDELDDEEDNEVGTSLDHTAKFDLAVPRASLAKQVIEEQKIYYASLFYRRGLIETLFSRWKTAVGMQLK